MIYQKIAKFTLSALLLTATGSAYAQETEPQVVTLKDGKTTTWSDFVNAINNPESIKGTVDKEISEAYKKAETDLTAATTKEQEATGKYETAQKNLTQWQARLSAIGNTKTPVTWLNDAYNSANTFATAYNKVLTDENYSDNTVNVWYLCQKEGRQNNVVTISFGEKPENIFSTASEKPEFQSKGETDLYNTLDKIQANRLYIYVGCSDDILNGYPDNFGRIQVIGSLTDLASSVASLAQNELRTMVNSGEYDKNAAEKATLTANINELTVADETGKTGLDKLEEASKAAKAQKTEADNAFKTAESNYNQAVMDANNNAIANYKTVTLTDNVTAATTIANFDGIIKGNNHIITLSNINYLFTTLSGTLANLAVNGGTTIAEIPQNASYTNVAYWNGTGVYRDVDNNRTEYQTLGALGFAARNTFGVNFTDKKLAWLEDNSKVYSITEYKPNSKQQFYAQTRDNAKFYTENGNEYSIADNMFVESATADLANDENYSNVIFDGKCKNVVITDTKHPDGFYCPMDITAANVTYDRTFKQGMNALCLPFDVYCTETNKIHENVTAVCRFDKETSDKFWFKKVAGTIPANTPVLMTTKAEGGDFKLDAMQNVTLKKTETQMVVDEGDETDPSKSYGLFMPAGREEFDGGKTKSYKVYGLSGNTFKVASENAVFSAFRMVLYSELAQPTGAMSAPRRIGIVDEKGIEITDELTAGIENVNTVEENDAPSLDIATGVGEINITSEADYGRVAIYTLDGKVAAMADVVAGTTTVNVQHGVYIVMGKKVMVK